MADVPDKILPAEIASLGRSVGEGGRVIWDDMHGLHHPVEDALPSRAGLADPTTNFESAQQPTEHTAGWHKPRPHALAAPSYAPAMTSFGLVFLALGAVTMWPLSVIGAIIFFLAIAKWIGELLHD